MIKKITTIAAVALLVTPAQASFLRDNKETFWNLKKSGKPQNKTREPETIVEKTSETRAIRKTTRANPTRSNPPS